jgi:hexokinase
MAMSRLSCLVASLKSALKRFLLSPLHCNRFEKYISGKYLGEVVRVVLKSLVEKDLLFTKASKETFPAPWKFGTDIVSHIEE